MNYAKAIFAALIAGLGALGTSLADGSISPFEWVGVASATVVAAAVVFGVPNLPAGGYDPANLNGPRHDAE